MRLSIKTKQVLGVTGTVGAIVVALSVYNLSQFARVSLQESHARADLLARAIYQRAYAIVPRAADPLAKLRDDGGLKSILEASNYSKEVTDAAVVDPNGVIIAHWDKSRIGKTLPPRPPMEPLLELNSVQQLWAVLTDPGREVEIQKPLTLGPPLDRDFGAIRIGISTLLVRGHLEEVLSNSITTGLGAVFLATVVAMLLAQVFLRPIHVLKSGLTRLQSGESGITLDLPKDEFGDLGTFFSAVSTKLSADRSELAGQKASLESIVERLEDAVALFDGRGDMLFANPTMRALLPPEGATAAPQAWRELVQTTIATRRAHGPVSITTPAGEGEGHPVEWLLMTHAIESADGRLVGVMLMGRNAGYLAEVQSTLQYSRKLTALGRLSAGVAHEVKNPLNAMMIHLELLRQKLSGVPVARAVRVSSDGPISLRLAEDREPAASVDSAGALEHVSVIAGEIKRLDQVLQGFLKFTRPEDLRLQAVEIDALTTEVGRVIEPEAHKHGVRIQIDAPPGLPAINGDASMLRQALLNLGINACQAMPHGGILRFAARAARARRVELVVEDTGVGIKPEHLKRVFDLYFTTREKGSGIGLSMVYRTVQLHDGEIEVQSTPGVGTTFRMLLPQA